MAKGSTGRTLLRNAVPLFGVVIMVVVIAFLLKQWFGGGAPDVSATEAAAGATNLVAKGVPARAAAARPATAKAPAAPAATAAAARVLAGIGQAAPFTAGESGKTAVDSSEAAQERAVERWEGLVDAAEDLTEPPTLEMAETFKKAFDAMTLANKSENITYALHLLPDSQFPVLYLVLFDKQEDPDILDEIFSDALNREEEIKIPLLKKIRADKTHPMWEEADRILEVILDE